MSVSTERSEGSPLAFLKFYGSDFLNATAAWTMEERGVYITLLWYSWVNGGLPGDIDRIDRMAPGAKACWQVLEPKFPIGPDGLRRNPRQERDRASMRARSESAAERGRRGAEQRWGSHGNSHPVAIEQPSHSHGYRMASQSSEFRGQSSDSEPEQTHLLNGGAVEPVSSIGDTKPSRRPAIPQAALDALWEKFPRKVGKKRAMALLDKGVREIMADFEHEHSEDAVIYMGERIDAMAQTHRTTDPQFIPHPATWLGQGRYLDPVTEETR